MSYHPTIVTSINLYLSMKADIKIQRERLADELIKTVTNFQKCTKSCMEKLKVFSRFRSSLRKIYEKIISINYTYYTDLQKFELQSNASFNKQKNNSHTLDPAEMQRQYDMGRSDVVQQRAQLQQDNLVELNMVQDRHKDIKKLENDIVDLNSIFKDLSVLVHDQGEIIGKNLNKIFMFFSKYILTVIIQIILK